MLFQLCGYGIEVSIDDGGGTGCIEASIDGGGRTGCIEVSIDDGGWTDSESGVSVDVSRGRRAFRAAQTIYVTDCSVHRIGRILAK